MTVLLFCIFSTGKNQKYYTLKLSIIVDIYNKVKIFQNLILQIQKKVIYVDNDGDTTCIKQTRNSIKYRYNRTPFALPPCIVPTLEKDIKIYLRLVHTQLRLPPEREQRSRDDIGVHRWLRDASA